MRKKRSECTLSVGDGSIAGWLHWLGEPGRVCWALSPDGYTYARHEPEASWGLTRCTPEEWAEGK